MHRPLLVAVGLLALSHMTPNAAAAPVELVDKQDGYQLLRDGKPFYINGAGGDGDLALLKQAGGNALRTWGVGPDTKAILDAAHEQGVAVVFGIWLGHERHGFDYNDDDQVAEQLAKVREAVETYKDHPAILAWSIGNEMEGYENADNAAIWSHVQAVAGIVNDLDPDHPTMTVTAEIGGQRVQNIHRLCPSIDIVGINSYGGSKSLPERYRAAVPEGFEPKPYVVTEYGPAGTWEVPMNEFGVPEEPTSTQKADVYRDVYTTLKQDDALCLGSFAFTWGAKREATSTWFGLFLASSDGESNNGVTMSDAAEKLGGVDALAEVWGGSVDNKAPTIQPLTADVRKGPAGAKITVETSVSDPEGDSLETEWILTAEQPEYFTGGDTQPEQPTYADAIGKATDESVTITLPEAPGVYRLYAFVRDGKGSAATASLPLLVEGSANAKAPAATGAAKPKLPLLLVGDDARSGYIPSGYMGDTGSITVNEASEEDPHAGKTSTRASFNKASGWGGVMYQSPANDWGDVAGGYDLTGAKKLTLWARGAKGGEVVTFGFGGIGQDKPFFDTASSEKRVTLTDEWKQYEIDLTDLDLSRIKSGFRWVVESSGDPIAFFIDDVQYE